MRPKRTVRRRRLAEKAAAVVWKAAVWKEVDCPPLPVVLAVEMEMAVVVVLAAVAQVAVSAVPVVAVAHSLY